MVVTDSEDGAQIVAQQLSRRYRGPHGDTKTVLESLNFTIESGEFVGLLGPSGSGKSTLLRLIAGLDQPQDGSLKIPTSNTGRIGYVFQEPYLMPWRTVLDNVLLPLELLRRTLDREVAREILNQVGLSDAADLYPNQLSGGMRMRVSLARALVTRPTLLLLDEPFAALDEPTRFQLQDDLRALWMRTGLTIVLVTHSFSEVAYLCERLLLISGRPAGIRLDHRLPLARERQRTDPALIKQIEFIGHEFRRAERA